MSHESNRVILACVSMIRERPGLLADAQQSDARRKLDRCPQCSSFRAHA